MEIVDCFSDRIQSMKYAEREEYMMGLAKLRVYGMTYIKLGGLVGYSASSVARHLKPYEQRYKQILRKNHEHLEQILTRVDPDYAYMTDKRTLLQETCALAMGGEEIKMVLNQLANLEQTQ